MPYIFKPISPLQKGGSSIGVYSQKLHDFKVIAARSAVPRRNEIVILICCDLGSTQISLANQITRRMFCAGSINRPSEGATGD